MSSALYKWPIFFYPIHWGLFEIFSGILIPASLLVFVQRAKPPSFLLGVLVVVCSYPFPS